MKIHFFLNKSAFSSIVENCRCALQQFISHNNMSDTGIQSGATPVYGRGMYGLLVISAHEQYRRP